MTLPGLMASYLGMSLRSPIIVGSCPMTLQPESVRQLSLAGAGAIVLPSLFEEQIVRHRRHHGETISHPESPVEDGSYEQMADNYNGGLLGYLAAITTHKRTADVPIIASLNGRADGHWLDFAVELQRAGADAIELMLEPEFIEPSLGGERIEQKLVTCVTSVCDQVSIPVSVKLSQYHTNLSNLAQQLTAAGAAGIVGFAHATTWEISTEQIQTSIQWSLTHAGYINPTIDGMIRLRAGEPAISLAASGGICSAQDVCRTVIAGADVAMVTSEIYRAGPDAVEAILTGLRNFLNLHHFDSFAEFVNSRPKPPLCFRQSRLASMTQSQRFEDPTPEVPHHSGDRWGHPS